jgi:ankyrin repeat protein
MRFEPNPRRDGWLALLVTVALASCGDDRPAGPDLDPRLLEVTLAGGADVAAKDRFNGTGLIRAAERGYARIVRLLLRTDIDVDHVNRLGWTALLEAIILGEGGRPHVATVRALVGAGADVNLADGDGVTPLTHARERGQREIAAILRAAGAT